MGYSTLLTSLQTSTAVAASATLPLGNATHGYGKGIVLNGNAIQIKPNGYYNFDASISLTVTGTDAVSVTLYKNGVAIPGAVASATPAAAGSVVNLDLTWIIRKNNCCSCDADVYTLVVSAAGTVNSLVTRTERM